MSASASIASARVVLIRTVATHAAWMCVAWLIVSWALGRLLPRCIGVLVRVLDDERARGRCFVDVCMRRVRRSRDGRFDAGVGAKADGRGD